MFRQYMEAYLTWHGDSSELYVEAMANLLDIIGGKSIHSFLSD